MHGYKSSIIAARDHPRKRWCVLLTSLKSIYIGFGLPEPLPLDGSALLGFVFEGVGVLGELSLSPK